MIEPTSEKRGMYCLDWDERFQEDVAWTQPPGPGKAQGCEQLLVVGITHNAFIPHWSKQPAI